MNGKQQVSGKGKTHINMVKTVKPYDLEERTLLFAKDVIKLCDSLPKNAINLELIRQLVRASGSVGANYREAGESLSKKDSIMRLKIARKECKESTYWLQLLMTANPQKCNEIEVLIEESKELRNIFSSILNKTKM